MLQNLRIAIQQRSSRARLISFSDVKPGGSRLAWFWHGHGMDDQGLVYVAIGNGEERRGGTGDVLLFSYNPASGEKRYLDSVCGILQRANNLGPNEHWPHAEGVAKVHSDLIEHRGRVYFSTHDMHRAENLAKHRGGHLLSYDPSSGEFQVLSRHLPGGVAVANEGIIGLNILRNENRLVGWTYPRGRLLLFDLDSRELEVLTRDPAEEIVGNVARVVAVTPGGTVYVAYTGQGASDRFYRADRDTGRLTATEFSHRHGFFEGVAQSSDGLATYLMDDNGDLYVIESGDESIRPLGNILPADQAASGQRVSQLRNLTLSPDGRKLWTVPTAVEGGPGSWCLYEYDTQTRASSCVADLRGVLKDSMLTGNGVMDSEGGFYLSCYFGTDGRMHRWYGERSGLVRIDVSDRILPITTPNA